MLSNLPLASYEVLLTIPICAALKVILIYDLMYRTLALAQVARPLLFDVMKISAVPCIATALMLQ